MLICCVSVLYLYYFCSICCTLLYFNYLYYVFSAVCSYQVFIADPSLYPDLSHKWLGNKWVNGQKIYLRDTATVQDLKAEVYAQQKPLAIRQKEEAAAAVAAAAAGDATEGGDKKEEVKLQYQDTTKLLVGCRGRMFADTDNLALAVRAFCKRDPNILIWKD